MINYFFNARELKGKIHQIKFENGKISTYQNLDTEAEIKFNTINLNNFILK